MADAFIRTRSNPRVRLSTAPVLRSIPRLPSPLGGSTSPRPGPSSSSYQRGPSATAVERDGASTGTPAPVRGRTSPATNVHPQPATSDGTTLRVPDSVRHIESPKGHHLVPLHDLHQLLSRPPGIGPDDKDVRRPLKIPVSGWRIPRSVTPAHREVIRRCEGGPCIGEPTLEFPLPKTELLNGWQSHRRISFSWPAIEMFFEGADVMDRLSFRRAQRVGSKAVRSAFVRRSLGSFFVPMKIRCDHAFVDSPIEATLITELHLWACALLGDGDAGLEFIVDFHDRSPIFQQTDDVHGVTRNEVQLAWELSSATRKFIDPMDLWFMLIPSTIGALRSLGSTHNIVKRGFRGVLDMSSDIPPELEHWWPPVGMSFPESKVLRFFSSMLRSPRAERGVELDARQSERRRRILRAARLEKLVGMLHTINGELKYYRRVPKLEPDIIRYLVEDCRIFLGTDRRWSWHPESSTWEHLIAVVSFVAKGNMKTSSQTTSYLHGEALHYVDVKELICSVSSAMESPDVNVIPRRARGNIDEAAAVPSSSQVVSKEVDNRKTIVDRPMVEPVSISEPTPLPVPPTSQSEQPTEVDSVPTKASNASERQNDVVPQVGPRSYRKVLIDSSNANKYCFRTKDLLFAYPGLRVALVNGHCDDLEVANLREMLQGASSALRAAENERPGMIRAARGGTKGSQQARRNAALTVENHELKEQNEYLRRRLDDALAQVGRLGELALEAGVRSAPSRQRRPRDGDRVDEPPAQRRRL